MTLLKRDKPYQTYADYLTGLPHYGDEMIDGTAYVREPPGPSWAHQGIAFQLGRQIAMRSKGNPVAYAWLRSTSAYPSPTRRTTWSTRSAT